MQVHYVHGYDADMEDPVLRKVLEYCALRDISITIRLYDPDNIEDDKDDIVRLPAMHVYKNRDYVDTLYPDVRPIQFLDRIFQKFKTEQAQREYKMQQWEERILQIKRAFYSSKTDSNGSK